MQQRGGHAVVLGGSMAGLLAARVLADAYGRVTIVERDPLPDRAGNRRGVPQGRHAHVLLPRGAQVLGELFPAGLLPLGDAICSSNPVYALGMSVTALQAAALRDTLAHGDHDLARRFFQAASEPVDVSWQLAVGADLALPQVQGPRPLPVRVMNAYLDRVQTAAERDPAVAAQFIEGVRDARCVRTLTGTRP